MSNAYAQLRAPYRPEKVRLLFVAESPPDPRDGPRRFFYAPERQGGELLFRALMRVVFDDFDDGPLGSKTEWLERFRDAGAYLIDLTDEPVNALPRRAKRDLLAAAVAPRVAEVRSLVTAETPIVLVKKNVYPLLAEPLRRAGLNVAHTEPLRFPRSNYHWEFVERCRAALGR